MIYGKTEAVSVDTRFIFGKETCESSIVIVGRFYWLVVNLFLSGAF